MTTHQAPNCPYVYFCAALCTNYVLWSSQSNSANVAGRLQFVYPQSWSVHPESAKSRLLCLGERYLPDPKSHSMTETSSDSKADISVAGLYGENGWESSTGYCLPSNSNWPATKVGSRATMSAMDDASSSLSRRMLSSFTSASKDQIVSNLAQPILQHTCVYHAKAVHSI